MAYSGKFKPKYPEKYVGDPDQIVYRSLWERRLMTKLDLNPKVTRWASEEIQVPYYSPIDRQAHRYFPDFWAEINGKRMLIEVKPAAQIPPSVMPIHEGKLTPAKRRRAVRDTIIWSTNKAKWDAAKALCEERGWDFYIVSEGKGLEFRWVRW